MDSSDHDNKADVIEALNSTSRTLTLIILKAWPKKFIPPEQHMLRTSMREINV